MRRFIIALMIATFSISPSLATGGHTRSADYTPKAQATRVAQNCAWVYREKLCQTEWGRRKYPNCC
jgi:hypothetical protein